MQRTTLYLASASPRRHEILKQLLIPHSVLQVPAPEGEDEPQLPEETPEDYVRRTARDKAVRAACRLEKSPPARVHENLSSSYTHQNGQCKNASASIVSDIHAYNPSSATTSWSGSASAPEICVLSADTTVVLDGKILRKPLNLTDAASTLRQLSGNVHHVHTAVALHHGTQVFEALSVSTVHFKNLSSTDIDLYCATGDPMGKAGAYGIQGPAAAFIAHLSGSYTGVMGLPAYETSELLAAVGWPTLSRRFVHPGQ